MVPHEIPPGNIKLIRRSWFGTAILQCSRASSAVITHTMIRPRGTTGLTQSRGGSSGLAGEGPAACDVPCGLFAVLSSNTTTTAWWPPPQSLWNT